MVVFEHVDQRFPQQLQVFLGKSGFFGQWRGNEAFHPVQAIGHDEFAADRAFLVHILFIGHRHAGNADFSRHDRINAFRKGKLDRSAYLPAINFGRHDGTECPDIEKVVAHPVSYHNGILFLFRQFFGFGLQIAGIVGHLIAAIQHCFFLNVDIETFGTVFRQFDIVADFAFQADIGYQTAVIFRIDPRHVSRVRVPIGIAVFDIEKKDEFIAVCNSGHGFAP